MWGATAVRQYAPRKPQWSITYEIPQQSFDDAVDARFDVEGYPVLVGRQRFEMLNCDFTNADGTRLARPAGLSATDQFR